MCKRTLFLLLIWLLIPVGIIAQTFESGTSKTGSVSKQVHDVWYTINLTEDGEVSFTCERLSNISSEHITIYAVVDGENVQRASGWVDGGNRTLTCSNLKPGTYKVKMSANPKDSKYSGTYRLTYNFTAPYYKTDPTPNDTWDDCPLLEDGVTMHGHLGYAYSPSDTDTDDWFRIDVPKDGKLTIETRTSATLRFGFVTFNVLNAEGNDVQQRNGTWRDIADSTLVWEIPDVAKGTYYLHLPRYSGYGIWHLTYRFTPSVVESDPELNDTWQTATQLNDGQKQDAHLGHYHNQSIYNDNVDWFKIVVPEDGKLTVETHTAPTLRIGYVTLNTLNPDGTDVVQRNGIWRDIADSTLVWEIPDVSEGTYYLCIPRYSGYGHYSLTHYFTGHSAEADPEPNDTWDTATPLRSGPSTTGQLGYDYKNTKDVNDWYMLKVPEEGSISLTIKSEPTLRIGVATINTVTADGSGLTERASKWLDIADSTLVFTLSNAAAGDYYLKLPHYNGYGTYTLRYVFTPCSKQNDAEPNDDWTTASEFAEGTATDARLGYDYSSSTDTKDWFKFDVPEEGTINLTIKSEPTLRIGVATINTVKADGSGLTQRADKWLDIADSTLVFTLSNAAAGVYYLYMPRYSGYGGYQMTYDFIPCNMANDAADNDTWETATPIAQSTTKEGRLGYDYSNSTDKQDWFKFDVPEEGTINLTIRSEKTLRIGVATINAVKADGNGLTQRADKWLDIADSTLVFTLANAAPGPYYLYLPRYGGYGGYRVTYDFTPCAIANDMAGNDSIGSATPIENGTITQGRLGYDYSNSTDKQDWYKFTMTADGSAKFIVQSEPTLKIGYAYIYTLKEDGESLTGRASRWLDIADSALVFKKDDLAAGDYYLYLPHYGGYGGYTVKSEFSKNPYYQKPMTNIDFASRITLEEGVPVQGTMGYAYRDGDDIREAWFDLGLIHGRQIDVNVEVESSHSLSIGVAALYRYKGDREDGSPILEKVTDSRLERSSGIISYVDKNTEDSHYIFYLPRYSGYGGYKVTFGNEKEEGTADFASSNIKVMTGGRNTVRKGVPCENPITISNFSDQPSDFFLLAVLPTEDIDIIGFRMPTENGTQYIPVDSVTIPDEKMCLFVVPKLLPWESYTFTMISEGKGDIAYAPERVVFDAQRRVIILGATVTVAAIGVFAKTAAISLATGFAIDWVSKKAGDAIFPSDSEAATQYANLMGATKDQLGIRSSWDSPAVYTAKSFVSTCTTEATKKIVPKTGTFLDVVGNTITALQNIIPNLRRRIWYWIYKDLGYFDNNSLDVLDGKQAITDVVASWDPNEMVGPAGVGEEHYIGPTQTISYRILFENKAEAGDAAYRIRISDELDEDVFDVSTVRFGETSHDGVGYSWKMKREGNRLSWDIEGIELPPNVNAPEGEGFVSFTVDLKPNLTNGTQIKNKATIIFDKNFPIETNEFVNTLDLIAPTTTMSSADISATGDAFNVHCISEDAGSGVGSYLFFVSEDGGEYTYYAQSSTGSIAYPITPGTTAKTYSFYVLATDNVGNVERVIPQVVYGDSSVDGIRLVNNPDASIKVYTIDGRYVGDGISGLKTGVYVVGGKKIFIK